MQAVRTAQQEAAEDIFFGQIVIIWARWFLIFAGIILILWSTTRAEDLVTGVLPIVALMAMNFFLHGRYLVEKPANRTLLIITSLIDLIIITLILLLWPPSGLKNDFFIFYYPVVLAVAFVFPQRMSVIYTLLIVLAYAGVSLATDPAAFSIVDNQKVLVQRLITIAAMGGLGTFYWRIQRSRRRAAVEGTAP
jgi:hypothetical protein